jgi:hypothetical protein
MVLVIVAALLFLSTAFTIRPAFPLAPSAALPPPLRPETLLPRGVAFERENWPERTAPMPPAEPVLAPAPHPPPPAPDPVNETTSIPPLSEARFFRL